MVEIVGVAVCTNRVVKTNVHLPFCRELHLVLKIELLLIVLYNFEREVALNDLAFQKVVYLTNKILLFVYNLIINLTGLAWHMVWYI